MNATSRSLSLPGVTTPVREIGASGLDRRAVCWPAPDPATVVAATWAAPTARALISTSLAPWAAPLARDRVDLPAPVALPAPAFVEPMHRLVAPDLVQAGRDAFRRDSHSRHVLEWAPPVVTTPTLPPPTLADAAAAEVDVAADRSGVNRRLTVGVTVLAGLCCAAVATVYGLL